MKRFLLATAVATAVEFDRMLLPAMVAFKTPGEDGGWVIWQNMVVLLRKLIEQAAPLLSKIPQFVVLRNEENCPDITSTVGESMRKIWLDAVLVMF